MNRVLVFLYCLFLGLGLTQLQGCDQAQAYQVYQGPPNGRYSDTTTIVNASGTAVDNLPTYSMALADITPAASATAISQVCGSSTKLVRVNHLQATADATTPSVIDFYFFKLSSPDTGGASSVPTVVPHDSSNPAPTAAVTSWSTNPTASGVKVGLLRADHYALPAASSTGYPGTPWEENFSGSRDQGVVLHGTNECVSFSFNGQTIPAGTTVYFSVDWTEQ